MSKKVILIDGVPQLRVKKVPAHGVRLEHLVVQCGCCKNKIEIYPLGLDDTPGYEIEIGGVLGAARDWRGILLPLLRISPLRSKAPHGLMRKLGAPLYDVSVEGKVLGFFQRPVKRRGAKK